MDVERKMGRKGPHKPQRGLGWDQKGVGCILLRCRLNLGGSVRWNRMTSTLVVRKSNVITLTQLETFGRLFRPVTGIRGPHCLMRVLYRGYSPQGAGLQ